MLDTIRIVGELVTITTSSFIEFPSVTPIGDLQIYKSSFFTTHWLRNETGAAIHFWTDREGVGSMSSYQDMAMLSSPGAGGADGVPLRAVAVSDKVLQYGIKKRQMSISELTLARSLDSESQGETWRSFGSEMSEDILSLGGSLDCGRKSGKLQCVEEMDVQVVSYSGNYVKVQYQSLELLQLVVDFESMNKEAILLRRKCTIIDFKYLTMVLLHLGL